MLPALGTLAASVGKEFLADKAVGLLNGKDKNEINDAQNEVSNEVPYDTSNEAPVEISNEYHSAEDDNPTINTSETEGNLETSDISENIPETTSQVEDIAEDIIPEANNTETEFSADNVVVPGEQEASEIQATTDSIDIADTTNNTSTLDTTSSIQPSSTSLPGPGSTMPVTSPMPSVPATDITPTSSSMSSEPSLDTIGNTGESNISQSDTLVEAIENKDPVAVENAIESDPVEAEKVLKDDTALDNEAKQAIDGGNDAEVNNEVVKEALKQDPEDLIEDKRTPSAGLNWDKIKVYRPGEDGYGSIANFNPNVPDFPVDNTIEIKENIKDEDFLGPDEYIDENGEIQVDPNWKPENADEDFLGPDEYIDENGNIQTAEPVAEDKQLAVLSDGIPEEIYSEPVYDTSDYNFDWDYDIQTLGVASPEEIPDAPVENKEQAKAKQRLMHWFKSKHLDQNSKSGPVDSAPSDKHNKRLSMAGRRAGALSIPTSGIGSVPSTSMGNGKEKQPGQATNNSIASKAPLPVALEDNQGREVSVNGKATTMPTSSKNGSMRSGSFGLMSKPSRSTKVGKPVGATSKGSYHTQSNGSIKSKSAIDGKEIIIERIKTLLSKLPSEATSKMGFKGDIYKGTPLNQYDGSTLQNISKQLENLIKE